MRTLSLVPLPPCPPAFATVAQTASGQWAAPAPAAGVAPVYDYRAQGNDATAKPSPIKSENERKTREKEPPPPRANDLNAVTGIARPWQNGQSPVGCAQTPRAPSCH
jgi:hypothetical protein